MKWLLDQQIIEIFIVYCRVGPCIMLFPGFAQPQIPARIRGLISLVIAMALWSHLGAGGRLPRLDTREAIVLCSAREFAFGVTLGLTGRCVMAALEMFGAAISASMGLTMNIGITISGDGQAPPLSGLLSLFAAALIFAADLHHVYIEAIAESYRIIAPGSSDAIFDPDLLLRRLTAAMELCAQMAGPFFLVAITINFTLALMARMAPQLQIFALSGPFLITGGFAILLFHGRDVIELMLKLLIDWTPR